MYSAELTKPPENLTVVIKFNSSNINEAKTVKFHQLIGSGLSCILNFNHNTNQFTNTEGTTYLCWSDEKRLPYTTSEGTHSVVTGYFEVAVTDDNGNCATVAVFTENNLVSGGCGPMSDSPGVCYRSDALDTLEASPLGTAFMGYQGLMDNICYLINDADILADNYDSFEDERETVGFSWKIL